MADRFHLGGHLVDRNREPRYPARAAGHGERDRRVHQTLSDRRAEACRCLRAPGQRRGDLGPIAVILDVLEVAERDLRIADHDARRIDERDAPVGARRDVVRQRVPGGPIHVGARGGRALDQGEPHEEIGADAGEQVRLDRGAQVQLAREQGQDDQTERTREQLAADSEPHGSSASPLPTADA